VDLARDVRLSRAGGADQQDGRGAGRGLVDHSSDRPHRLGASEQRAAIAHGGLAAEPDDLASQIVVLGRARDRGLEGRGLLVVRALDDVERPETQRLGGRRRLSVRGDRDERQVGGALRQHGEKSQRVTARRVELGHDDVERHA
jgi:hypothetical protein